MKTSDRVEKFISYICDVLLIEEPTAYSYDFAFEQARFGEIKKDYEPIDYTLRLPSISEIEKRRVYHFATIAHELRHAYQLQQYKYYLEGDLDEVEYTSEEIKAIEEDYKKMKEVGEESSPRLMQGYNLQFIEVDANAFAAVTMQVLFGIKIWAEENANGEDVTAKQQELVDARMADVLSVITQEDYLLNLQFHKIDLNEMKEWLTEGSKSSKFN